MAKLAPRGPRLRFATAPVSSFDAFPICIDLAYNQHSVEVFFIFHPHANRLFHGPTFIASLSLSPTHPKFPVAPVLHAICAIGSLYTAAVSSPPLPDFDKMEPGMPERDLPKGFL